ncbi:hypothetical protein LTS01_006942 [Friedmanniomyces endolithicus]|nr:hypothetical protein LTS01_006942 [Friedmanniomyces endolithicus]
MGAKNFPWQLMEAARHAVVILHENFDLTDEQRYNVFKQAFLNEAQTIRPGTSIMAYSLSDAYNCRLRSDRKPWWITHNGDKPNDVEKVRRDAVRATALTKLQEAARELGIANATLGGTAVAGETPAESGKEDSEELESMSGDGIEGSAGAGTVQVAAEGDVQPTSPTRNEEDHERQHTMELSQLGRFASWRLVDLLEGMSINLKTPAYPDLLDFCRTHAKKRKLSIAQYLERRLGQAGSKRAKATQRTGRPALASSDSDNQPDEREEVDDMRPHVPVQRKRKFTKRTLGPASRINSSRDQSRLNERTLKMVHHRDCVWQGPSSSCQAGTYVDSASEVYKTGGKVFRTFINDKLEDVMICQPSICGYCTTGRDDAAASIDDAAPSSRESATHVLNGLPFVHNGDVTLDGRGMPRYFKGTSSGWSPVFPKDMYPSVVDFTVDGETVEKVAVMACYARNCNACTSNVKVVDETVDHRPVSRAHKRQRVGGDEGEVRNRAMVADETEKAGEVATMVVTRGRSKKLLWSYGTVQK